MLHTAAQSSERNNEHTKNLNLLGKGSIYLFISLIIGLFNDAVFCPRLHNVDLWGGDRRGRAV